jgi:hypothetical protein
MAKDKDNGLFVMKRGGDALSPDGGIEAKKDLGTSHILRMFDVCEKEAPGGSVG